MAKNKKAKEEALKIHRTNVVAAHFMRGFGVSVGLVMVCLGVALMLMGFQGVIDFELSLGSELQTKLVNASPGIVLCLLGAIVSVVALTRKVRFEMNDILSVSDCVDFGPRL